MCVVIITNRQFLDIFDEQTCLKIKSAMFFFQLQENLADYISSNITLAWDHVGFLCHSSGCEEFLTLFETFDDPTFAKVKMRHLQMFLSVLL